MDPVQAADFEKALLNDSSLRCEMNLYQEVDKALADSEILALRSQLNTIHEPVLQEIDGIGQQRKRVLGYSISAASIVMFIGIGIFGLFNLFSLDSDKIIDKFYFPYEMSSVHRSATLSIDQILQDALIKYDNKEYKDAVILFEKVLDAEPEMISAHLYSGISYFEIKEFNNAEASFKKVIDHNDNLYIEQAEWYIGFCYLMTGKKDKALDQFAKIASGNGYFNEKAKRILKKLT